MKLSSFQYECLWMAIRYASKRSTGHCTMFPNDVQKYLHLLSDEQKYGILDDVRSAVKYREAHFDEDYNLYWKELLSILEE